MKKAHNTLTPKLVVLDNNVYMEVELGLSKKLIKMDDSLLLKCSALFNTLDRDVALCFKPKAID